MPKLTNRLNLPAALVQALTNDPYDGGGADYSATTLIKPPRVVALERQFRNDIQEDAADRIYSLLGQVVHGILERAGDVEESVVEERFFATIGETSISGQIDIYNRREKHLQDWKLTTGYKFKDGRPSQEHIEQLNIGAFLMRLNGYEVERASIVGLLRDWSRPKAQQDRSYPQAQVVIVDAPLWTFEQQLEFIEKRIALHEAAKITLPDCTPEERWAKDPSFAIMKNGNKRAEKANIYSREMAEILADNLGQARPRDKFSVVERPGAQTTRCGYCPARPHCSQYKKLTEGASDE